MWSKSASWGRHPLVGFISLLILLFTLVACGSNGQTANAGTSGNTSDTTPTVPVKVGSQPCPETVSTTQYWDAVVPTQPPNNKVENVTCASLMGTSALQALVAVRSVGSGRALDIHVYNNITAPKPDEVLKFAKPLARRCKDKWL